MQYVKAEAFFTGSITEIRPANQTMKDRILVTELPWGYSISPLVPSQRDWALNVTLVLNDAVELAWIVVQVRRGKSPRVYSQGKLPLENAVDFLNKMLNDAIDEVS